MKQQELNDSDSDTSEANFKVKRMPDSSKLPRRGLVLNILPS